MDYKAYFEGLSPELQEKARSCKSMKEILDLAESNNIEIPVDVLSEVSGGIAYTAGNFTPDELWNSIKQRAGCS